MITIKDLLRLVEKNCPESLEMVNKAYDFASILHRKQKRDSGEPYIVHPLTTAYILAQQRLDGDTICAGLLHDTLEDTNITKNDIEHYFNKEIAKLVEGVTKLSRLQFSTKKEQNMANMRKYMTGAIEDIRIIYIKTADRLHNMRTLQYKSKEKQIENSYETLRVYAPFANFIGAYESKIELEELAFSYIKPENYKRIEDTKNQILENSKDCLVEMLTTLKKTLSNEQILNKVDLNTKNIYRINLMLEKGEKINNIHDLLIFKVLVNDILDSYKALGLIHSKYKPDNENFKDYIANPKKNMYRSIHTTVFAPNSQLVQAQIRTTEMDIIASYGLSAYWDIYKNNSRGETQQKIAEQFQVFKSLKQIDSTFTDNEEFLNQVEKELFSDRIHVYKANGEMLELPKGSSAIDCAYAIHTKLGNQMIAAKVNDNKVKPSYILKNEDRVIIISDPLSPGPNHEWIDQTITTKAKKRIKEKLQNRVKS